MDAEAAARALKVHWVAHGLLTRRGESLRIRLTLYDSLGARIAGVSVRDSVTLEVNFDNPLAPSPPLGVGVSETARGSSAGAFPARREGRAAKPAANHGCDPVWLVKQSP